MTNNLINHYNNNHQRNQVNNDNSNSNNKNDNNILQPSAHTHQNKGLVRDFEGKTAFRKIF